MKDQGRGEEVELKPGVPRPEVLQIQRQAWSENTVHSQEVRGATWSRMIR